MSRLHERTQLGWSAEWDPTDFMCHIDGEPFYMEID